MNIERSLRGGIALAAVAVAIGGCGKNEKAPVKTPDQIGHLVLASCTDNNIDTGGNIEIQPDDLSGNIDTSELFPTISANKFELVQTLNPSTQEPQDEDIEPSASFLTVEVSDQGACYQSRIDRQLSSASKKSLLAAVGTNLPYLEAAAKDGALEQIDFRLIEKDSLLPDMIYDTPEYFEDVFSNGVTKPTIEYPMDYRGRLPAKDIQTMLRHETLHALTSNIDMSADNKLLDKERAEAFGAACNELRNIALGQAANHASSIVMQLKDLAQKANPDQSAIILNLTKRLVDGTLGDQEPKQDDQSGKVDEKFGYGNVPECKVVPIWHLALREMERKGIDYYSFTDKDEILNKVTALLQDWDEVIRDHTIYRTLREGTYLGDNRSIGQGHPYDNWDETIASIINVALTFPDQFAKNVNQLPEKQQKAISSVLDESLNALNKAHPDLKLPDIPEIN